MPNKQTKEQGKAVDDDPGGMRERNELHGIIADATFSKEDILRILEYAKKLRQKESGQK